MKILKTNYDNRGIPSYVDLGEYTGQELPANTDYSTYEVVEDCFFTLLEETSNQRLLNGTGYKSPKISPSS